MKSIFQLPLPAIRTCVRLAAIQQWRWTAQRIGAICNDGSRFSTYWRRQPFLNGRPFPNGQPFLTTTDTTVAVVDASRNLTFERCPRHLSPRHLRCLHQQGSGGREKRNTPSLLKEVHRQQAEPVAAVLVSWLEEVSCSDLQKAKPESRSKFLPARPCCEWRLVHTPQYRTPT